MQGQIMTEPRRKQGSIDHKAALDVTAINMCKEGITALSRNLEKH